MTVRTTTCGPAVAPVLALGLALGVTAGCATDATPDPDAPPTAEQVARGEAVYREVCSECHSLNPPPSLAPPFTHVGRMLESQLTERSEFTRHVVAYVQSPSEERSLLPAEAIRRFGLMPAQLLPPERLEDAAAYLWTMADSAQGGMNHESGEDHEGGVVGGARGLGAGADTTTSGDALR